FFFSSRRRHTRFSRDWSSDVCSSDLYRCGSSSRRVAERPGLGSGVDSIIQFLNRLGPARVAAMATVAVLMLGFFGFLMMRASARSEGRRGGKERSIVGVWCEG